MSIHVFDVHLSSVVYKTLIKETLLQCTKSRVAWLQCQIAASELGWGRWGTMSIAQAIRI